MQIIFPQHKQDVQYVKNIQDLRQKLCSLSTMRSRNEKIAYSLKYSGGKLGNQSYIYAKCKSCSSRIRFKYQQDNRQFKLTFLNNKHTHTFKKKNEQLFRIRNFIQSLPELPLSSLKEIAIAQLRISTSQFYYFYSRIKNSKINFKGLISNLSSEYQVYVQEDQFPELVIIVSNTMKKYFERYHHYISIDMTYSLIKKVDLQEPTYKVGIIIGSSLSKKIVPLALVVAANESKLTYLTIFRQFFQIMGRVSPVIISDEAVSIRSAVETLNIENGTQIVHILDNWHILKNVKRKLSQKFMIAHFAKLCHSKDQGQFQRALADLHDKIDVSQMEILTQFVHKSHLYCFAHLPRILLGGGSNDSPSEKINDLLKSLIRNQRPIGTVIHTILPYLQKMLFRCEEVQNCKIPYEKYYNFPQLKYVRWMLDKKVFKLITDELSKIIHLTTEVDSTGIVVKNIYEDQFKLFKSSSRLYQCTCQYTQRSGLPCSHLLKWILMNNEKIEPYIHQKWRRKVKIPVERRGRSRGTRTNRIK